MHIHFICCILIIIQQLHSIDFFIGNAMNATATIQTRVSMTLKQEAERLFASIGIDMTSAIRLFLTQSVVQQKIPFESVAPEERFTAETVAAMEESRAISEGRIPAKRYTSFKEAAADIGLSVAEPGYLGAKPLSRAGEEGEFEREKPPLRK